MAQPIKISVDQIPETLKVKRVAELSTAQYALTRRSDGGVATIFTETEARVLAAAPAMLRMLADMAHRDNAPASVPIKTMLAGQGIELVWPEEEET